MKYAVVQNANGNFTIISEHGTNLDAAIMKWHDQCKLLRNDAPTLTYTCKVVNERLEAVGAYSESVDRTPIPETEA